MFLRFTCLKHPEARVQRSDGVQLPTMEILPDSWIDVHMDSVYCSVSNGDHDHNRAEDFVIEFLPAKGDKIAFAGGTMVQLWGREG